MKDAQLPENVELLRTRVVIEKDRVFSVGLNIIFLKEPHIKHVTFIG